MTPNHLQKRLKCKTIECFNCLNRSDIISQVWVCYRGEIRFSGHCSNDLQWPGNDLRFENQLWPPKKSSTHSLHIRNIITLNKIRFLKILSQNMRFFKVIKCQTQGHWKMTSMTWQWPANDLAMTFQCDLEKSHVLVQGFKKYHFIRSYDVPDV